MKISTVIKKLKEIEEKYGDLPVLIESDRPGFGRARKTISAAQKKMSPYSSIYPNKKYISIEFNGFTF